jgi:hypothetical protein
VNTLQDVINELKQKAGEYCLSDEADFEGGDECKHKQDAFADGVHAGEVEHARRTLIAMGIRFKHPTPSKCASYRLEDDKVTYSGRNSIQKDDTDPKEVK